MLKRLFVTFAICILALPALAQHNPLQYHGGPILRTFKIYPLYYGNWNNDELTAQQNYLESLAGYLSGNNAPAGQQPATWQYGVYEASVAPAATDNPNKPITNLSTEEIQKIIKKNQKDKKLPDFGPNILIMVFPAHGISLTDCTGCGYHHSESTSAFWGVVPQDAGVGTPIKGPIPDPPASQELVLGHEVFEAALDPGITQMVGWDECVDGCPDGMTKYGGSWVNLSFGWIPGPTDNTQNGSCSSTGYTSNNETQAYGVSFTDYKKKYDELWPKGWRIYILQSYVVPNGDVLYNAVWRESKDDEQQLYASSYSNYKNTYDGLLSQGWRLYILQSYVTGGGEILYNAVFRKGDLGEKSTYTSTFKQYHTQYDQIWTEKWRLQSLQSFEVGGKVVYNAVWRPGDCDEKQMCGKSFTDYKKKYDEIWPDGWRLYILQSYVKSDGKVLYNAFWRQASMPEEQAYGQSLTDYKKKYDELWPQGWRLYILDTYVTGDGQVLYNAVWRQGCLDRPL